MDHNATIGARIKRLRVSKNFTLKQLSEQTGLSTGFLSQLERGLSPIAIDSLAKIASILDVELETFFKADSLETSPVCRSFELKSTQVSPQIIQHLLTRDINEFNMLPRMFLLLPFSDPNPDNLEMYHHSGEEFIYVLEGVLTLYVGGSRYVMNPGDSIQIHSEQDHNWMNQTNRIVRILTVNLPNPFSSETGG